MRGEHPSASELGGSSRGIIPACAGSTSSSQPVMSVVWGSSPHARGAPRVSRPSSCGGKDHPRMRGEHKRLQINRKKVLRIIPACAGSTRTRAPRDSSVSGSSPHARGARDFDNLEEPTCWDHPRMRGEHPPRAEARAQGVGIIPACAGSTGARESHSQGSTGSSPHARGARSDSNAIFIRNRDHPRMRGEHVEGLHGRALLEGIIPACAGSTLSVRSL